MAEQVVPGDLSTSNTSSYNDTLQQTELLEPSLDEYLRISNDFAVFMLSSEIIAVKKIYNKWLLEKYSWNKDRLCKKNKGVVNERWLYHSSSQTNPAVIYEGEIGFDTRFSKGTCNLLRF